MSNYRRVRRFAGRSILQEQDREYRMTWLQPIDESRVPAQVYVFEREDAWRGHRYLDPAKLELTWIKGLWKEVPNPFGDLPVNQVNDDDNEETLEEEPIP